MNLGEKIKKIRKKFDLSQEQLAEIMNVSRQAITKWESNNGLPDTCNLQQLSKTFGITIDYLLDSNNELPLLVMRKELDKAEYHNKIDSYYDILSKYYPEPWEVYTLSKTTKMNKIEWFLNILGTAGKYYLIKQASDFSPYYLVRKDGLNLLVNIKDWGLEVRELPDGIDLKKFTVGKNKFRRIGRLKKGI